MGRLERRSQGIVYPALLIVAAVVFLSPALFTSQVLLPADLMTRYLPLAALTKPLEVNNPITSDVVEQFYPYRAFLRSEASQGRLPLWNPYSQNGTPFLASSVSALFSPLQWLMLAFPPALSFEYEALAKMLLAGLGMFFFCRKLGLEPRCSFAAALLYEFAGYNIFFLCYTNTAVSALLGWGLFFLESYLQNGRRRLLAGFSMVLALGYLGGQMENALLFHLACGLYALVRDRRRLMPVFAASLLGFLIAAAAVFPFADFMLDSATFAQRSQIAAGRNPFYLHLHAWKALIFPHPFAGMKLAGGPPSRFSFESLAYWGIIPFFLSILGLADWRRKRRVAALGAVLVWAVGMLLGLPGIFDLFTAFPVLRQGNHMHIAFLLCGAGAALAAVGLQRLAHGEASRNQRRGALAAALAFAAFSWLVPPENLFDPAPVRVLAALMIVWLVQSSRLLVPIAALTVLADAFLFGFLFNTRADPDKTVNLTPPVAEVMQRHPHQRLVSLGVATFPPNYGMRWGIRDFRGYETMRAGRYVRMASEVVQNPQDVHFWVVDPDERQWRLLRRAGCGFVFSPEKLERDDLVPVIAEHPYLYRIAAGSRAAIASAAAAAATPEQALQLAGSLPESTLILEGTGPQPLITSQGRFSWLADEPDLVELEVEMQGPGWLVLRDTFEKGWQAEVNGRPTPIRPADFLFRAVPVPQGRSVVRFEYRPRSFIWGSAVSLAALLAWAAMLIAPLRINR